MTNNPTATDAFAGIGLTHCALSQYFQVVQAIECIKRIAHCYSYNFPETQMFQDLIQKLDPRDFIPTVLVHGSPSCKNATSLNQGVESVEDVESAKAFLAIIKYMHRVSGGMLPRFVTIENVKNYFDKFFSFKLIRKGLEKLGFFCHIQDLDAEDVGVPQRRSRGWARFAKQPLMNMQFEPSHIGWRDAIARHIPDLPVSKFADWQVRRLIEKYGVASKDELYRKLKGQSYIIERVGAGNKRIQVIPPNEPVFTLRSLSDNHTQQMMLWLPSGEVRKVTPPALWDLQMYGCPVNYEFPPGTAVSTQVTGIGNGVPYRMSDLVFRSLLNL